MGKSRNVTIHDVYFLGKNCYYLQEALVIGQQWGTVKAGLEFMCSLKDVNGLEFIGVAADDFMIRFQKQYGDDENKRVNNDSYELHQWLTRLEGRLEEIWDKWVISCPETHIAIRKLLNGAKTFLGKEEFAILKPLEEQGLNEATLCLLHNNYTSSEFMSLRTAESLLRRWYEKKTGISLPRAKWGDILDKLDEKYPKATRPKELSLLDYLRERRNEIAHPEVISTEEEATGTFLNVIRLCRAVKSELLS